MTKSTKKSRQDNGSSPPTPAPGAESATTAVSEDAVPADNTAEIRARLRRLERRGGLLFIATPLMLLLIGGRDLAGLTIVIWPVYAVIYLGLFRRATARFEDSDWVIVSRSSRRYTLRRACELMLMLYALGFAMYGCERARDVFGDGTQAATTPLQAPVVARRI